MSHIELARWADLILIAPTSANFMAKLAHGLADDLLSTICIATTSPIMLAPAMNTKMWLNLATQENKTLLIKRGIHFIDPVVGLQACGDTGMGKMEEPQEIIFALSAYLNKSLKLSNNKIFNYCWTHSRSN